MARSRWFWRVTFLSIPLLLYLVIVVGPLLYSFFFSLTDRNGFSYDFNFVGLDNFAKIFEDPLFGGAIKNTVIWMVAALTIPTLGGLALALALQTQLRGARLFKSLFYLPI